MRKWRNLVEQKGNEGRCLEVQSRALPATASRGVLGFERGALVRFWSLRNSRRGGRRATIAQ